MTTAVLQIQRHNNTRNDDDEEEEEDNATDDDTTSSSSSYPLFSSASQLTQHYIPFSIHRKGGDGAEEERNTTRTKEEFTSSSSTILVNQIVIGDMIPMTKEETKKEKPNRSYRIECICLALVIYRWHKFMI